MQYRNDGCWIESFVNSVLLWIHTNFTLSHQIVCKKQTGTARIDFLIWFILSTNVLRAK